MAHNPTRQGRRAQSSDRWVALPPDPAVLNALGGGHTLESAIADIIDNSIDADAGRVRVRFLTNNAYLLGIQIRDDGTGMSAETLESALTLGSRRKYTESDLGNFGIGLKAASMRHTSTLTVYSASALGDELTYAGIEFSPASNTSEIGAFILSAARAETGYRYGAYADAETSGAVVQWSEIKGASASASKRDREEWLNSTIERIRSTLGLVFHRLLENGDVQLQLDVYDVAAEAAGPPRTVRPLSPFAYHLSGDNRFPQELTRTTAQGASVVMLCHVLPPKGVDHLGGKKEDWQGLYVYRNNRLLTIAAGWQGLTTPKRELRLARISLELTDELLPYVAPTPEKNGVVLDADVLRLMESSNSTITGMTFTEYLECAIATMKVSNKRSTDKPLTQISSGLPAELIGTIGESFGWRANKSSASITWKTLHYDRFFHVDLARRELQINERYRKVFGDESGPSAHILATLLFILTEEIFTRESHIRTSTIEHLRHIESALLAAIKFSGEPAVKPATTLRATPSAALAALKASAEHRPIQSASLPMHWPAATSEESMFSTFDLVAADDQLDLFPAPTSNLEAITILDEASITQPSVGVSKERITLAVEAEATPFSTPTARSATLPEMPGSPLTSADLDAFTHYCLGNTISETAHALESLEHEIALSLTRAFFGDDATSDDATLAPYHGMAYTPSERERILRLFHNGQGQDVLEIAHQVGRTPFAVAWRLLDSPKRPVPINKRVRRSVRRRLTA